MKKIILLIVVLLITTLANAQRRICIFDGTSYVSCSWSYTQPSPFVLDSVPNVYVHSGDSLYYRLFSGSVYVSYARWYLGMTSGNDTIRNNVSSIPIINTYHDSIICTRTGNPGSFEYNYTRIKFYPNPAGVISGPSSVCYNGSSIYTINPISYATSYKWISSNGTTYTTATPTITLSNLTSSQTLSVYGYNGVNGDTSTLFSITVNPYPITAGTISGATTACQSQNSVTYNVPTITNATSYIWSLPNGVTGTSTTNSITVNYGASAVSGNITVKGHNSCGDGAISTLAITVNSLVASAGTISGVATACQGQNSVTYNVPTIDNATSYIWTLPNGATGTSSTNNITVNYGASAVSGNITVKGHNSCGDGAISSLPITVNPLPSSAGNISGATTVCLPENAVTYTVPTISNATSYIWTLPNGASGTSTTNSISVTYGTATTGNITVKGHNDCGDGAISTLPITITQTPATPTISNIGNNVLSSNSTSGNQWYNQNGIINGAVSQNYTVTANGSFYVIVKFGNCYSDSSSHIQVTNTGIENNISNDVFSIYPNPTKNSLNVTVDQKLIGSEFTITDQLGRTVITGKLTAENTVVEVGNLSNGIYLLRIGANAQQTFKVVKE